MKAPLLAIIMPCYNEEEVLPESVPRVLAVLENIVKEGLVREDSYVLLVDDGSVDATWEVIKDLKKKFNNRIKAFKLSRNFGHQSALLCGLLECDYDIAITLDADLQDPPELIKEMVLKYLQGYKIVYGVRKERKVDSFFKRTTAKAFYKLMSLLGTPVIENHADYRLISKEVKEILKDMKEVNLFLRGLIPYIGFKGAKVEYERKRRIAGKTKYSLKKMVSFAWEGITSFSIIPLRLITFLGFIIFLTSLIMSIWAIFVKLMGKSIAGWLSIVLPMYIIGGLNLFFLGIIGEYIGKIYTEVKRRPRYIIEEKLI